MGVCMLAMNQGCKLAATSGLECLMKKEANFKLEHRLAYAHVVLRLGEDDLNRKQATTCARCPLEATASSLRANCKPSECLLRGGDIVAAVTYRKV